MEEKKPFEISEETMDQVTGGNGPYIRSITIQGIEIHCRADLDRLCKFLDTLLEQKHDRSFVIGLLGEYEPSWIITEYIAGGCQQLAERLDRYLMTP